MFARFMPQEGKFFDLFNAHAEQVVLGSEALVALLSVLNESDEDAAKQCELIDVIENRADGITHETMRQLHKSFITPLDREEIHQLITSLDDILDLIQDVAHTVTLYNVRHITAEAINLSELCRSCCERVRAAVSLLPSMDNGPEILKICHEIDQLESAADREMRGAMSRLFREEPDVRELIKFKAIYELLETVTDRCEDVANIIEGIVLENS
jgi:predicted phosphate transport protein (TIGR00153 family)